MRAHRINGGAVLAAFWMTAGLAQAQPLNVTDFDSLGAFPSAPGDYTINTSGDPTLTAPDGTVITGVVYGQIAVFTFDAIAIGSGMTVTANGDRPLALLSYSDVTIDDTGFINVNGQNATGTVAGAGGPGGGGGGNGGTNLQGAKPGRGPGGGGISGGGGFGGRGGGFNGGASYGNLDSLLEGGSGGGGGSGGPAGTAGGGGGGGGGTIEIGALGDVIIAGHSILAMGGSGGAGTGGRASGGAGGGGGSGGGIFLHGDSVWLQSLLSAPGGTGGSGHLGGAGGGGGGGGQVFILTGQGGFWNGGGIDVSGGTGPGGDGDAGTIIIIEPAIVPVEYESATLALGGLGALALLDFARRFRKRVAESLSGTGAAS
jgi:hypothetical protein